MTLLHVYFALRNQQAFHRLLERDRSGNMPTQSKSASASAGESWTRKNLAAALEVNALDDLGRTVLHLACASTDPASLEYVRMLLAHPALNVNLRDKENHWTALHRALYTGNIEAAVLLLKRADTETFIKDAEGYTAFDLYNSTIKTADPTALEDGRAELLTWGANRNAALGLGDGNDRTHPDHVLVPKKSVPSNRTLHERFQPIGVRDVSMSKLHTVILTNEPRDNLRLCGFGSGGRLGPFSHTLYAPTSLSISSHTIVSVTLGQDHTLALTSAGEVFSWGLNRFAQLGYLVEAGHGGSPDESIQTTPRKISHLKKEFIRGVAACKTASACWSDDDVWTWGTNGGQLGYSKTSSPIQILPRKVSIIMQPIRGIAMSETAMVCLFLTGEVICVWNGGASKISFPAHAFPSDISMVYRPPQAIRGPTIKKLACCDDLFAALSANGEVFTFSLPTTSEAEANNPIVHVGGRGQVKPQRVWALRRQFSSIQDVDVGGDGALIVCTQSGHVFVRSRNPGSGKTLKFQRVAHMQRAVKVCANSTGAFGTLRVDYKPSPINVTGRQFSADMASIVPSLSDEASAPAYNVSLDTIVDTDDDQEDSSIMDDIAQVAKLITFLSGRESRKKNHRGADLCIRVGTFETFAHRVILASRCVPLCEVLRSDGRVLDDQSSGIAVTFALDQPDLSPRPPVLHFTGIIPLSLLVLLHYLYADAVLAIWDRRIESVFETQLSSLDSSAARVKADLAVLARLLDLGHLVASLQSVGKRIVKPSASGDFRRLFDQAQVSAFPRNIHTDPLAPDVALHLADKIIYAHSAILSARSVFFAAMFTDLDWTLERRDGAGIVDIEMGHLTWRVMQLVLRFVCFGDEDMFETLEFLDSVDEVLEFMFLVMSAANELLLTRLVLLCSQVVLRYLNTYNACYLLTEALHLNAVELADRIQSYMSANGETLLESRILDDLDQHVLRKLMDHVRSEQAAQFPVSRSDQLGRAALEKHKAWLALQDIPVPIVPSQKAWSGKDGSKISPPGSAKKAMGRSIDSPTTSPTLGPSLGVRQQQQHQQVQPLGDDIFAMDGLPPPLGLPGPAREEASEPAKPGWKKGSATPRTDLKAIMTEAENGKKQAHARALDVGSVGAGGRVGVESTGTTTTTNPSSSARQSRVGSSPLRQPALGQRWPSDGVAAPARRVPSDYAPATPPKPVPSPLSTPTRSTSITARTTDTHALPMAGTSSGASPMRSTMGPVITPVRQPHSVGSSARKPSLGGAWTLPPVQPIAEPTVPGSTMSLIEIQRMQEMQATSTTKDKRSLRAIQEEERALQREADFLKWWAEEEERVRVEMTAEAQAQGGGRDRDRRSGNSKGKSKGKSRVPSQAGKDLPGGTSSRGHGKSRKEGAPHA